MAITTVVGPLDSEKDANETALSLGNQYSVYSKFIKDEEGYDTESREWFVERDDSIASNKIFGYDTKSFMARQYK